MNFNMNNTSKSVSTLNTLENVANRYCINLFELYDSMMSETPEMEAENPYCYKKVMEGYEVPQYTFYFDGYDYFDWEDSLEFSPKTSTKRYNKRDKNKHGRKYKKVNDPCGEKWNRANILFKKHKKAINKQVMEDLESMNSIKMSEDELLVIVQFSYSKINVPMTKTFNQVLGEVMNFIQFNMDIDFADKNVWYEVRTLTESCYANSELEMEQTIRNLREARYELITLETCVSRYEKEIEYMGLNPNDF